MEVWLSSSLQYSYSLLLLEVAPVSYFYKKPPHPTTHSLVNANGLKPLQVIFRSVYR